MPCSSQIIIEMICGVISLMIQEEYGIYLMPCSSQIIQEMVSEIPTV